MARRQHEQTLTRLADELAIRAVLATYAAAIDHGDWSLLDAVFTPDATLDYSSSGGPSEGRDEAIAWIRESLSSLDFAQHLITNERIVIDGDQATSTAYFLNPLTLPGDDGPRPLLVSGTYADQWTRTDQGWRISERVEHMQWSNPPLQPGRGP